jgi:hypothetical protein
VTGDDEIALPLPADHERGYAAATAPEIGTNGIAPAVPAV